MKLYRSPLPVCRPVSLAARTFVRASTQPCFFRDQIGSKATFTNWNTIKAQCLSHSLVPGSSFRQDSTHIPDMQRKNCFSTGGPRCETFNSDTFGQPIIHSIFESRTGTWQYVVADPSTSSAVIIDPVLNFDPTTRIITSESADLLLSLVKHHGYEVNRILETHIHADHLTAASYLQHALAREQTLRPPICIGKRIEKLQNMFGCRYGIPVHEYQGAFDHLLDDDELFPIGSLNAQAIHLPGHTPDHLGYWIGDNVFCGDSIFHADIGTARCDFPGGDAVSLYQSARKLLALPDHVKIWTGHDYPPPERTDPVPWLSVQEHRSRNKHLMEGSTETVFVALRHDRDTKLAEPKLLHQSLQINIRAGQLPKTSQTAQRMLHLPLKLHCPAW